MLNIGPSELIVIFLVALIVVGPKRLPEIGRTIGKSLREFRRATDDFKQQLDFGIDRDEFLDQAHEEEPNGQEPAKPSLPAPPPDDPETQPHPSS
jgi:Tat protein translocase TatB subunit